jgi:hypothetical protein
MQKYPKGAFKSYCKQKEKKKVYISDNDELVRAHEGKTEDK